jgi:hypothetical protein
MGRHGPEPPASYIAGASTQSNKQVVFLREGDMGVPWDPKLFPLNKVCHSHYKLVPLLNAIHP